MFRISSSGINPFEAFRWFIFLDPCCDGCAAAIIRSNIALSGTRRHSQRRQDDFHRFRCGVSMDGSLSMRRGDQGLRSMPVDRRKSGSLGRPASERESPPRVGVSQEKPVNFEKVDEKDLASSDAGKRIVTAIHPYELTINGEPIDIQPRIDPMHKTSPSGILVSGDPRQPTKGLSLGN